MKHLSVLAPYGAAAHRLPLVGFFLLYLALLLPRLTLAQAPRAVKAGAAPSVAGILNPDGTVQPGVSGSFDATGFQLSYGKGGQPVLTPAAKEPVAKTAAAGWNGLGGDALGTQNGVGLVGTVRAMAVSGSNVYVGGNFYTAGGFRANNVARWDGTAWSSLGTGAANGVGSVTSNVLALAVSGSDVYVGGDFTTAGGNPANRVARWDGTSWSPLGTSTNNGVGGTVRALALSGTSIYIGGTFTAAGTTAANNIARWDGAAWNTLGTGTTNGTVSGVVCLAVSGPDLYVGGTFASAGGISANKVARWNGTVWSSLGTGAANGVSGGSASVLCMAVSGTDLYVGGNFTTAGGVAVSNVARWDGAAWNALGPLAASRAYADVFGLAVIGSNVYVAGTASVSGGYVSRWDGTTWSSVVLGPSTSFNSLYAAVASGTDLYVGGFFREVSGVSANGLARFNGTTWSPLGTGAATGTNNLVNAVAVSGSNVYVGGQFNTAGGAPANYVARWNGTAWSSLGTSTANGLNSTAYALALVGADLYVGGDFTTAGGVAANYVARWDGTSWSPLIAGPANGVNSPVFALAANGASLYVGGIFTTAGGVAANRIARWDGTAFSPLGMGAANGMNGDVLALALSGADLYVGGSFLTAGGSPANRIARWDGTAWSPLGTGADNVVNTLAAGGGNLYAGGDFTTVGGTAANRVARWDGTAWSPLGTGAANGVDNTVNALAVSGRTVYVGGRFTTSGGVAASKVARWDGTAWTAVATGTALVKGSGPGAQPYVQTLLLSGSNLYTGGVFTTVDGVTANNIAYYSTVTPPTLTALSAGTGPVGSTLTITGTNLAGAISASFNGAVQTSFISNSATQITLLVPAGATTGPLTVTTSAGGTSNSLSFIVGPLATAPGRAAASVQLYPNPTHAAATLVGAAPGARVAVFDVRGRLVASVLADATGTAALALPRGLAAGVYVVRVGSQALRLAVE